MVDPMSGVMIEHVNGVGLWIAAQIRKGIDLPELLRRAERAYPELPEEIFVRSYNMMRSMEFDLTGCYAHAHA